MIQKNKTEIDSLIFLSDQLREQNKTIKTLENLVAELQGLVGIIFDYSAGLHSTQEMFELKMETEEMKREEEE